MAWADRFHHDPVVPLLNSGNDAIIFFTKANLLGETDAVEKLWQLPEPEKILRKQQPDGCWIYPGANRDIRDQENYNQIETYRQLGVLVEQFGFNVNHPGIKRAAEYLFTFQTAEGDFRGIYGNQYTPNYTAGIAELLIKAGYEDDARIKRVFEWLASIRQLDGGWAIPLRTRRRKLDAIYMKAPTIDPDKSKPFSHMVTAVVLRAFAAHGYYRETEEARRAGELLASSLFKKDNYPDRGTRDYWLKFSFPFWFTDLISALDSLSRLGLSRQGPHIREGLRWFVENQKKDGLWELKILKGRNRDVLSLWLALSICRIFKRFYG